MYGVHVLFSHRRTYYDKLIRNKFCMHIKDYSIPVRDASMRVIKSYDEWRVTALFASMAGLRNAPRAQTKLAAFSLVEKLGFPMSQLPV